MHPSQSLDLKTQAGALVALRSHPLLFTTIALRGTVVTIDDFTTLAICLLTFTTFTGRIIAVFNRLYSHFMFQLRGLQITLCHLQSTNNNRYKYIK